MSLVRRKGVHKNMQMYIGAFLIALAVSFFFDSQNNFVSDKSRGDGRAG